MPSLSWIISLIFSIVALAVTRSGKTLPLKRLTLI
jgi:hypothetical protein